MEIFFKQKQTFLFLHLLKTKHENPFCMLKVKCQPINDELQKSILIKVVCSFNANKYILWSFYPFVSGIP